MIVYEECPPAIRVGECDVGGRRASARLFPYTGDHDGPLSRFDPIERVFRSPRLDATVAVGPHQREAWRAALSRVPPGPVVVGPCSAAEEVRGAYRAAAEAARESGRGAYLLDPEPPGLPATPGPWAIVLFSWSGDADPLTERIESAVRAGFTVGLLLPVIPGWTSEPGFLDDLLETLRRGGCRAVAAVSPRHDGDARRRLVEARGDVQGFFERIHHLDWEAALPEAVRMVSSAVATAGLEAFPPRPSGLEEPKANARAAARLEERAASAPDDHRFALLHAAARWIDESGWDLKTVLAEGNFRKVFPFTPEIAAEAENALREAGP